MHRGYLKLWRKSIESPVWADPDLWRTWCCCLMLANHRDRTVLVDKSGESIALQAGQFITGREAFHHAMFPKKSKSNPSARTSWRWLEALQTLENLSIKTSNRFSIVTITQWGLYQADNFQNVQPNVPIVSRSCPDSVPIVSTNKNDKNVKKKKHSAPEIPFDFTIFWSEFPRGRKKSKGSAMESWAKAISLAPPAVLIQRAKDYAASKEGRGPYVKMPSTWLNQRCWEDDDAAWNRSDETEQERPYDE